MPIDFHAAQNRATYASREADSSWFTAVSRAAHPAGKSIYDIGCGGGVYTRAWAALGAARVIGVDFAAGAVQVARAQTSSPNISYHVADAADTRLPGSSADILFARALIHHLPDLPAFFAETCRLLQSGGQILIQARTHEDVRQPAAPDHLRGCYVELFPRLLDVEDARRHSIDEIEELLRAAGFVDVSSSTFWEKHAGYGTMDAFADQLRGRRASSILHELDDVEIERLINHIGQLVGGDVEIVMRSRFTLWQGRKA